MSEVRLRFIYLIEQLVDHVHFIQNLGALAGYPRWVGSKVVASIIQEPKGQVPQHGIGGAQFFVTVAWMAEVAESIPDFVQGIVLANDSVKSASS